MKQNIIKFDLFQKKINYELIIQDLCQKFSVLNQNFNNLEDKYKSIMEENKRRKLKNKRKIEQFREYS